MTKKVLFCATMDYHFKAFHLPYMSWFKDQGWEVHVAANGQIELPHVDAKFDIPFERSPFKWQNRNVFNRLKSIINANDYDIIHCHTPMGGVLARLAARKARKQGTKVLYTAHGFHFCKGGPLINWLLYYPIEKWLSHYTDCLITINEEDYRLAVNHRFKAKRIDHVHGVGVNTERFKPWTEDEKREARNMLGYAADDVLMFYAAEFNKNKNQQYLIQALALIQHEAPHAKLLLAGEGPLKEGCRDLAARLGIADKVDFLGYRTDIDKLLPMCDIAVASSAREGLPVNIMEAMACGLPVIASDNRGHRELVRNDLNGWIVAANEVNIMAERIITLVRSKPMQRKLGMAGRQMIEADYSIRKVLDEKRKIYSLFMEEKAEVLWAIQ
ncbi:glycosyltransferase family 4 protein [Paenibacillus sp. UNC451MF]|uniref:glycosyltransferase family 4 protein n=1 Tax=Paenibacillus sp. UNC451MF TaxID=1449063 RepID=UPI0004921B33|nr:glycosyltransferase family 4 protein [Paenibacillus sp. UNC451MF]